jgi:hypothetical protein
MPLTQQPDHDTIADSHDDHYLNHHYLDHYHLYHYKRKISSNTLGDQPC